MSASMSGIVGSSTTWMQPSGAPAATAASASGAGGVGADLAGHRVRADDDRVSGHQRQQHLEVDRGDRVGGRRQRQHDAGRPGQLDDRARRRRCGRHVVVPAVPLDDAARAGLVLDPLVLDDAHPGLADRPLGIPFGVLVCRLGRPPPRSAMSAAGRSRRTPSPPSAHAGASCRARGRRPARGGLPAHPAPLTRGRRLSAARRAPGRSTPRCGRAPRRPAPGPAGCPA